ncbi:DUF126 domain-containing protein [Streptomyces bathyalis]|uniref:DUF126 domain-containing protein n=1 Tax=Streptomyces bathyalis TaxID=2710756 RepID=A0A7T1WSZ3_9ACTN|nr:DUF126 domain-containing protein [Streptomyces bathyalis]QPP08049.1 DUF126 domain-containing protein [Streptomyces bathyalis]
MSGSGTVRGPALVLDEPLSFWGGLDPATGRIVDVHHPQHGRSVAGTVLVAAAARGSTSSPSVLAESVRAGVGPAAVVLTEADAGVAAAATVVEELYGRPLPVVLCAPGTLTALRTADPLAISDGVLERLAPGG